MSHVKRIVVGLAGLLVPPIMTFCIALLGATTDCGDSGIVCGFLSLVEGRIGNLLAILYAASSFILLL